MSKEDRDGTDRVVFQAPRGASERARGRRSLPGGARGSSTNRYGRFRPRAGCIQDGHIQTSPLGRPSECQEEDRRSACQGKAIEITGGDYVITKRVRYTCLRCHADWQAPMGTDDPKRCPKCGNNDMQPVAGEIGPANANRDCHGGCGHGRQDR